MPKSVNISRSSLHGRKAGNWRTMSSVCQHLTRHGGEGKGSRIKFQHSCVVLHFGEVGPGPSTGLVDDGGFLVTCLPLWCGLAVSSSSPLMELIRIDKVDFDPFERVARQRRRVVVLIRVHLWKSTDRNPYNISVGHNFNSFLCEFLLGLSEFILHWLEFI